MSRTVSGFHPRMEVQERSDLIAWCMNHGYDCLCPSHYPVPAIPLEVSWVDANLGYLDIWIGVDCCTRTGWYFGERFDCE